MPRGRRCGQMIPLAEDAIEQHGKLCLVAVKVSLEKVDFERVNTTAATSSNEELMQGWLSSDSMEEATVPVRASEALWMDESHSEEENCHPETIDSNAKSSSTSSKARSRPPLDERHNEQAGTGTASRAIKL